MKLQTALWWWIDHVAWFEDERQITILACVHSQALDGESKHGRPKRQECFCFIDAINGKHESDGRCGDTSKILTASTVQADRIIPERNNKRK
jgi:hypothetical protein